MDIQFTPQALQDLQAWRNAHNARVLARIRALLADAVKTPYKGIGKPEPLKYDLSKCWSRRITQEHRLVYTVKGDALIVLALRYHY